MDRVLATAFAPPGEPRFYRWFGLLPGVRAVGTHIGDYAAYWRTAAEAALADPSGVLVALGDSLAQGIGASSPERSWVGRVRHSLSVGGSLPPVLNLSRSGARIADVVGTQLPALERSGVTPRLVVCTVGSNDILHSARLGRTWDRFTELLDGLPPGAVVATLPEKGSRVAALMNRNVRRRAADTGRPIADVGRQLTSWRGRVSGDGFHPNDAGYEVWANAFTAAVKASAIRC